jgi:hypothetical protein
VRAALFVGRAEISTMRNEHDDDLNMARVEGG